MHASARPCWIASPIAPTSSRPAPSRTASAEHSSSVSAAGREAQTKPLRDPKLDALLAGGARSSGMLTDQVAQDAPEIRHCLASARFTALDTAKRDALVGRCARLLHQLRESTATQM